MAPSVSVLMALIVLPFEHHDLYFFRDSNLHPAATSRFSQYLSFTAVPLLSTASLF